MNEQQFFNVAVAIIGAFGGWWMRVMWQSLKELAAIVISLKPLAAMAAMTSFIT